VRRSLERRFVIRADPRLVAAGLAVDAEATLVDDFGRFRPEVAELWRADEFTVEQLDGSSLENKEPTVAGYGFRGDFIGHRCGLLIPDDVVTKTNAREGAERDALIELWDDVIEARLEPDGVLPLTGQRLSAVDLHAYCQGQVLADDDDEEVERDDDAPRKVYKLISFPAYFPELDTGPESRRRDAPPWPDGPLLDPRRIPWSKLAQLRQNKPETFATAYQQQDGAPSDVLVRDMWVYGGTGADGVMHPGCVDRGRRIGTMPPDLAEPVLSIASVDPSGEKSWGFVWMLYQPETDFRYVVDIERARMAAGEVITYNPTSRKCEGLMPDWQERSAALGRPITHWLVEINAAQRFLLAHDYVRQWMSQNQVEILKHTTHRFNKSHEEYGIEAIIPQVWRHGRIRLPDRTANWQTQAFIHEHLTWRPGKRSGTDLVMAAWFPELHWPAIRPSKPLPKLSVPDWVTREVAVA